MDNKEIIELYLRFANAYSNIGMNETSLEYIGKAKRLMEFEEKTFPVVKEIDTRTVWIKFSDRENYESRKEELFEILINCGSEEVKNTSVMVWLDKEKQLKELPSSMHNNRVDIECLIERFGEDSVEEVYGTKTVKEYPRHN